MFQIKFVLITVLINHVLEQLRSIMSNLRVTKKVVSLRQTRNRINVKLKAFCETSQVSSPMSTFQPTHLTLVTFST